MRVGKGGSGVRGGGRRYSTLVVFTVAVIVVVVIVVVVVVAVVGRGGRVVVSDVDVVPRERNRFYQRPGATSPARNGKTETTVRNVAVAAKTAQGEVR